MEESTFGKFFITGGVAGVLGGAVSFIIWLIAGVAGLLRNRPSGRTVFTVISVIVLVLSFVTPLAGQEQTEAATKIVLIATHFVVFFAVVPTLRQRMA
jgi:hypothetical protein